VSTSDADEIQPVQRGSAANPNAAFSPPRFDSDGPVSPVPTPRRVPVKKTAAGSTASSSTGADAWSAPENTASPKAAPSRSMEAPTPPPTPKTGDTITPNDSSEPPSLDVSPEGTGGKDVHPPAK
jgi:hypothetical protein